MTIDLSNLGITKIKNKTTINGKQLQILEFKHKDDSMITRKELIAICSQHQKSLQNKFGDGIISVSIEFPMRWFSADTTRLNEDINYISLDDYEEYEADPGEYKTFRFMFIEQTPPPEDGGKDEHNDCLVKCIRKALGNHKSKFMIVAEELKEQLNLNRDDPIAINDMEKVESYVNKKLRCRKDMNAYSIYITGDHDYTSLNNTNKRINITLSNGHYSLDMTKIKIMHCKTYDEKPILMIEFDKAEIKTFDGESISVITRQELNDMNNIFERQYTPVIRDTLNDKLKGKCIEDAYYLYKEMADEMKQHLGGKYNFYKCGSVKDMALQAFLENTKAVQPEKISFSESKWINEASCGAVMYWEQFKGTVHEYDVNSRYPHIMQKNNHYFPIKQGDYLLLEELSEILEFGIYRCVITKQDDKPCKFFRFNPKNKYTHLDIEVARVYGHKVNLIKDGKPNALIYTKDKLMNGAYLFKTYVEELYELKQNKVKGAKDLLNVLWGGLTESTHYYHNISQEEECDVSEATITRINVDSKIRIECIYHKHRQFKTRWARIKPFVLAYGRHRMFYSFRKFEPLIVRIHTDGFYLKEKCDELKTGPELGNLKYEVHEVNILGINKINKKK